MFKHRLRFEDLIIYAESPDGGHTYRVFTDIFGEHQNSPEITVSAHIFSLMCAICINPEGTLPEPQQSELYAVVEPLIEGWDVALRPIP